MYVPNPKIDSKRSSTQTNKQTNKDDEGKQFTSYAPDRHAMVFARARARRAGWNKNKNDNNEEVRLAGHHHQAQERGISIYSPAYAETGSRASHASRMRFYDLGEASHTLAVP